MRGGHGSLSPLPGAIIGFGQVAEAAHAAALGRLGLVVAAVADPSPARRAAAAQALPGARIYDSAAALLAAEAPTWVLVATPPVNHAAAALAALARGAHVLVEKPLCPTAAEGTALLASARAAGRTLACVHNWNHAPILARLAALVAEGAVGRVRELRWTTLRQKPAGSAAPGDGDWRTDPARAGGGIWFDHGWHAASVLLELAGRPARTVRARLERRLGLGVEDNAAVEIDFGPGLGARVDLSWTADKRQSRVDVIGERGAIHVVDDTLSIVAAGAGEPEKFTDSLAAGGYRPTWCEGVARRFRAEIDGAAAAGTGAVEAAACLELVLAGYTSAAHGEKPVAIAATAAPAGANPAADAAADAAPGDKLGQAGRSRGR
jgi:predicted dehydrogenase